MNKIKVLHIVNGMNRAGAETFLMNIFRNINRQNYDFSFLCYGEEKYDYEEEIKKLGGHIERIDIPKEVGIFKHLKQLKKLIKDNNYDIVHAHTYYNSGFSMLAAYLCNVKLRITHSHNTQSEYKPSILKRIYYLFSKILIILFSNKYLACTEEAGKSLFGKRKFEIVNNGIELEKFAFKEKNRIQIRKELKIKDEDIVIGHIGRFDKQKNHEFLINIFEQLYIANKNYKLLLIGKGKLQEDIIKMVKEKGIDKEVMFLGIKEDIHRYYSAFDIFLFPSLFEGLGIVLIEAQANGLKCYTSDVVPRDVDISEEVKFLSLSISAKEWAERIEQYNKSRITNMEFLEGSDYNISNTVRQIEEIYQGR